MIGVILIFYQKNPEKIATQNALERRQHVALFLGSTHADDEDEFTVGLDYEYLFHEMLGVGCLIDHAGGNLGTSYQLSGKTSKSRGCHRCKIFGL